MKPPAAAPSSTAAHYRVWKAFTLDSAVRLRHAPEGDARRRIHGHTFTLRLHLKAPLDQVMGWTVDFGDVKNAVRAAVRAAGPRSAA
jgi:6-pyruvoyl-tetrahydropterin synthase